MLKHGDYLKPFTREDAMDIIAFAHMAKFPMHPYRASDHRALIFGPDALYFSKEHGLSGGTGPGGRPVTKREFLTQIANSDDNNKFEACTMYKLGIEPGAIVKPDGVHAFIVPPYTMWTPLSGSYAWMQKDGAPHGYCWINTEVQLLADSYNVHPAGVEVSKLCVNQWVRLKDKERLPNAIFRVADASKDGTRAWLENYKQWVFASELLAVSAARIPQPMEDTEIRVGDTVERTVDNKTLDRPHLKKGFIGVVTEINGNGLHFETPGGVGDRDKYRKVIARTLMDDVIRAGDWVDGAWIKGELDRWGSKYRVAKADSEALWVEETTNGELVKYPFSSYKLNKAKAGGPVSTIQQQPHEYQVSGATVQKREPVEGRCIQRPVPGRSCAVGSRHQGHGARVAVSRAKCRNGFISFTVQWSPDPPAGR